MRKPFCRRFFALGFASLAAASVASAQPTQDWVRTETHDDCVDYNALRNPYFGDTHLHTAYSMDAMFLRVRTDPRDAYNFAQGGVQGLPPYDAFGDPTRSYQLKRPLDFLAVTDHAEQFGETQVCFDNTTAGYSDSLCSDIRDNLANPTNGPPVLPPPIFLTWLGALSPADPQRFSQVCGATNVDCAAASALVWQDTQDAAEQYYDRSSACTFTTFVAYEWTAQPNGDNIHRNIIFRNAETLPVPLSAYEDSTPEGLFNYLDANCLNQPGNCDVMTIPHNSNTSEGLMFSPIKTDLSLMTALDAEQRARFERVAEIYQNKGNSECNLMFSSSDEECGFESIHRKKNFGTWNLNSIYDRLSFVREGLKEGLKQKQLLGVNPFELGFVGGTDNHSNLPGGTVEKDYAEHGCIGEIDSQPEWHISNNQVNGIEGSGGSLSVVWAEENSRDAIFSAMRRRETYATSGTRPIVRFFAGRMPAEVCSDPQYVEQGYDRGVPMGGELGPVKGSKSPVFTVMAQKDPGGNGEPSTPLQRIEVVKGWIDDEGQQQERVFVVAGEAASKADADVDLSTCTPTGTTGHDSLCAVWSDPTFDATEDAFYYARVIENPVCRWHQYLCNAAGVDCSNPGSVPDEFENCCKDYWPGKIQERAWTSPVYYIPERSGVAKASIKYGQSTGEDSLKLSAVVGKLGPDFDVAANDLTVALEDDDNIFNATIPAGSFEAAGNGTTFKLKDPTGLAFGGIKTAVLKTKAGKPATLKLSTVKMDLAAADQSNHEVKWSIAIGSYTSTDETIWEYDGKSLAIPKK